MDNPSTTTFTLKKVAEQLGVPTSTIRFYCNKGLVPNVRRARNGYRVLDDGQIEWVRTLIFLRRCGFSTTEMKKYASLCRNGQKTIPERKSMLETKKRQIWQGLQDLQENIDFIERRQEYFDQFLGKKVDSGTNWI